MAAGTFVYNGLSWIEPTGLLGPGSLVRHPAKRRRVSSVMQELIALPVLYVVHFGHTLQTGVAEYRFSGRGGRWNGEATSKLEDSCRVETVEGFGHGYTVEVDRGAHPPAGLVAATGVGGA